MNTKKTFAITAVLASLMMIMVPGMQLTSAQLMSPEALPPGATIVLYLLNDESGSIETTDPDADATTCSDTTDCSEWELLLQGEAAGLQDAFDTRPDLFGKITIVKVGFGTGVAERCREVVDSQADLDSLKACILASPKDDGLTNHGDAFQYVADDVPLTPADFHIIDMITDGVTTTGPIPAGPSRDAAITAGVDRIVGLVIGDAADPTEVATWAYPPLGGGPIDPGVLPEDGGFVLTVNTFDEFADAFKRKLAEIPQTVVGGEFLPIDSNALFIAGFQSSAIWMLPALAGAAVTGAYIIRTRMN